MVDRRKKGLSNKMKSINGNKSVIIGMAIDGILEIGERVFSEVNSQTYEITREKNHQGEWIGVKEI